MTREESLHKIKRLFSWLTISPENLLFVPTILVEEIQKWPEVIEMLKDSVQEGTSAPQLHGWQHLDYAAEPQSKIERHLDMSLEWFNTVLGYAPTIWATPWGAKASTAMDLACAKYYIKVETTENTIGPGRAVEILKGSPIQPVPADTSIPTIFSHFYDAGLNLRRVAEICKHGYPKAKELYGNGKKGTDWL
jgi:peptidoglycan/xylan/chitin deacetylase (PgdA/CDA1 family)